MEFDQIEKVTYYGLINREKHFKGLKGGNIMKIKPKVIVILVIIALCLIILFQNQQVVTLRIFFWNMAMPQIIFMPLIFIIGFILGFLVSKWTGRRQSK